MKIGVIGGGAWGTALAHICAQRGEDVRLWARNQAVVSVINHDHRNPKYLPDTALSPSIAATTDLGDLGECDLLLVVTPAQHMREVLSQATIGTRPLVLCAKGIEASSQMLMSQVARDVCPDAPIAILSGPTFAHEVAAGLPTAVTLACANTALAQRIAARIARPHFRPYVCDDVIGAEIGGAAKNVLAIACGAIEGRHLGKNSSAALIARGFAEMTCFGLAMGAQAETMGGLSGLGDLVLTCTSPASRNYSLGRCLGRSEAANVGNHVTEGAYTAPVLQKIAQRIGVDMPVTDAVCALLSGRVDIDEVVSTLLARPLRTEG